MAPSTETETPQFPDPETDTTHEPDTGAEARKPRRKPYRDGPLLRDPRIPQPVIFGDQAKAALARGKAVCHPDRKMHAQGFCSACYQRKHHYERQARLKTVKGREAESKEKETEALIKFLDAKAELDRLGKRVKGLLVTNLEQYVEDHAQASRVAASKGDARPAEWALSNIKIPGGDPIVPPAAKVAGETGIKVLIGVKIGGLPEGTSDVQAIAEVSDGQHRDSKTPPNPSNVSEGVLV